MMLAFLVVSLPPVRMLIGDVGSMTGPTRWHVDPAPLQRGRDAAPRVR